MPSLANVIDDVKSIVFPQGCVNVHLHARNNDRWVVYVELPYGHQTAKLEFIIEDTNGDPDVAASVIRYGSLSRRAIARFMDAVLERLGPDDQTSASE